MLAFTRDGRIIATVSRDGTGRLWDGETGAPRATLTGHEAMIEAVDFSPDGARVVTGSLDGTARVWNSQTRSVAAHARGPRGQCGDGRVQPRRQAHRDRFARQARRGSGTPKTGTLLITLPEHGGMVTSASFSPGRHPHRHQLE